MTTFANPVTLSLATAQTYITHGSHVASPLRWAVNTITSSKKIRKDRWTFEIARDNEGRHIGWLKLGSAIRDHAWDANLISLAEARETITISVAFNATGCEDLHVQLQP
jgi:hypothetical protein